MKSFGNGIEGLNRRVDVLLFFVDRIISLLIPPIILAAAGRHYTQSNQFSCLSLETFAKTEREKVPCHVLHSEESRKAVIKNLWSNLSLQNRMKQYISYRCGTAKRTVVGMLFTLLVSGPLFGRDGVNSGNYNN